MYVMFVYVLGVCSLLIMQVRSRTRTKCQLKETNMRHISGDTECCKKYKDETITQPDTVL